MERQTLLAVRIRDAVVDELRACADVAVILEANPELLVDLEARIQTCLLDAMQDLDRALDRLFGA